MGVEPGECGLPTNIQPCVALMLRKYYASSHHLEGTSPPSLDRLMKIVEDNYNVACDILEKPGYEQARAEWETEQAADKAIWAKEWDTYTQSLANKEEHTPADQTQA